MKSLLGLSGAPLLFMEFKIKSLIRKNTKKKVEKCKKVKVNEVKGQNIFEGESAKLSKKKIEGDKTFMMIGRLGSFMMEGETRRRRTMWKNVHAGKIRMRLQ